MTADIIVKEKRDKCPKNFDKKQVLLAVKALDKHISTQKSSSLFLDSPTRFLLDITAFKTPSGIHQFYNIQLPHTPYPQDLDILLVVRDVKGKEPEQVVGEVKDELRTSKIKIRQIMTVKQLKDEFSTHEAKRALSKAVDVVICEQKVYKMMPVLLGREFRLKKKHHLGIPGRELTREHDLGEQIQWALRKAVLCLSLKGQNSTVVVGHNTLTPTQLTENISKIAYWLKLKFPGGWRNVQKLSLHVSDLNGIPPLVIYFSPEAGNELKKVPITKGGLAPKPVEGEVSTQPGKVIRVHATGDVDVFERKKLSDEEKELIEALADRKRKWEGKMDKNGKRVKVEEAKEEVKDEDSDDEEEDLELKEDSDEGEEEVEAEVKEDEDEEEDEGVDSEDETEEVQQEDDEEEEEESETEEKEEEDDDDDSDEAEEEEDEQDDDDEDDEDDD